MRVSERKSKAGLITVEDARVNNEIKYLEQNADVFKCCPSRKFVVEMEAVDVHLQVKPTELS